MHGSLNVSAEALYTIQKVSSGIRNTSTANCTLSNLTCSTEEYHGNPYMGPLWMEFIYISVYLIMVGTAIIGNCVVIWIVLAHERMRTVTNFFIVNLAISDIGISIFNSVFNYIFLLRSHWPFGLAYCKICQFLANLFICVSVLTFVAIALDRYIAILHPFKPRLSRRVVVSVTAVIWLVSALASLPNAIVYSTDHLSNETITCTFTWTVESDFVYNMFLTCLMYIIPLPIITVAYIRIGIELWSKKTIGEITPAQEQNLRLKRKVVKMMIAVVVIFAVCWLPQHIVILLSLRNPDILRWSGIQHLYLAVYWLAMSNCMYNPMIYCWMNQRFRQGFQIAFRWCPCVHWPPENGQNLLGKNAVCRTMSGLHKNTSIKSNSTEVQTLPLLSMKPNPVVHSISKSDRGDLA